ncbi:AraC family transcriptional regulator [Psychrobium sp. 1_MG-2023]|uniref:AraC family transcriptional regulator n=1 Tax=Psychrobium sp. 1_MG-2023 TaxID=3062624 RepID=UPI000C346753|nr:AraC family transcriptional regulator [Psychrobium sp. 1_MG-2023]MDP2560670.1 AraC family transcriptional regulator ligand-binding domain-containing protein [Psychrobium sp. 1_MG-2023]PKF56566.1 AraC family transcriptional regulator [Alteromonadales bacterium alter-6D02]
MSQTTLSTIPKLLIQVLEVNEIDARAVFKQAGIEFDSIDDKNHRIPMEDMATLWQHCVKATNNPELGLIAASLFHPAYLKGVGMAWMASANLEQGLRRFIENSQLINTAMQIELLEKQDELVIQYSPPQSRQRVSPHPCAIQLGVGFFLKMFRLAASKNIPATAVYFTFDITDSLPAYEEFFQCKIYPNSTMNGIAFSKSLLSELLPTYDAELVELNEIAIKNYLKTMKQSQVCVEVVNIITERLDKESVTEEAVAYRMNMSKRTLQRKLNAESASFLGLLTSVRVSLAKQHLTTTSASVTEIAYLLGYSSPSTFARAFKQKTNRSPNEYRQQNT